MEENIDSVVEDLITQLKISTSSPKRVENVSIDKEQLESFLIENSGNLIVKSLSILDTVQEYISTAPDAKDVAAFAELLKATSASIEAMNKIYISIERNKTVKEVKQMDVESREKINTQDNTTFLLTRKEVMAELLKQKDSEEARVIEV
jgi:cyanophycinase-like exopeptidase